MTFPVGNIAPEGSVIKSTAIDLSVINEEGIYYHQGVAKVYLSEKTAIYDIKHDKIKAGDILVIIGAGPSGTGMEETYQVTSALKHLSYGKHVSLITDARFSGVSTGACIGHVGPEAPAAPSGNYAAGISSKLKSTANNSRERSIFWVSLTLRLSLTRGGDYYIKWQKQPS
jgi:dihydroxyacid dehydratase/phosphogluconate dehydratase